METFEKITRFFFAILFCGALVILALDAVVRRWLADRRAARRGAEQGSGLPDRRRRPRPARPPLDWDEAAATAPPLRPTRLMPKPAPKPRAGDRRLSW